MERPFRVSSGTAAGVSAAVLSLGLAVLFLPGMPPALIWPYEWVIVGLWWALGIVLLLRLPKVEACPRAEQKLVPSPTTRQV